MGKNIKDNNITVSNISLYPLSLYPIYTVLEERIFVIFVEIMSSLDLRYR